MGGVLRRQPGRNLRVRRLGDRPLPLHLDQLHAGVRVPHLGAPAHAGRARLLVIAAAEGPEFLQPEAVALDTFTVEILRRWRPTADRRWQLGRLDKVTVQADRERLGLAVDALLENAVRHTADGDVIKLSVVAVGYGLPVRMVVADTGQGIPADLLRHVFDRFRSGDSGPPRGTGLGLALVSAVARAHGGEVLVQSTPGQGSEFELLLPAPAGPLELMPGADPGTPAGAGAAGGRLARKP
jgi:signal transduction histidine kinase